LIKRDTSILIFASLTTTERNTDIDITGVVVTRECQALTYTYLTVAALCLKETFCYVNTVGV